MIRTLTNKFSGDNSTSNIGSAVVLKMDSNILGVDSWCQREQNGAVSQTIGVVCFDLSGGDLKRLQQNAQNLSHQRNDYAKGIY